MKLHRKYAEGTDGTEQLRREAELLGAASHPGVVEILGVDGDDARSELVTVGVPGTPLDRIADMPAPELAALVAAVATTLADLHDRGQVHGAVTARHIIVRDDGFGILCGFGCGGRLGELPPGATRVLAAHEDVAGLARIILQLATGPDGRRLRTIANRAMVAGSVPTARQLALELQSAGSDTRPPRRAAKVEPDFTRLPTPARPAPARVRRTTTLVAALAVLGSGAILAGLRLAGTGVVGVKGRAEPAAPPAGATVTTAPMVGAPASKPTGQPAGSPLAPGNPANEARTPRHSCQAVHAVLVADVDGDGCNDALEYRNGILEGAGLRWKLGFDDDVVVAGDWSCSGARTLAVLRPATGEVVWFNGWAAPGQDLTAEPIDRVEGGQALRAADIDGDGCHELVVERTDGSSQLLRPGGRVRRSATP